MLVMKTTVAIAILAAVPLLADDTVRAAEAKNHIGETIAVCGKVVDTRYQETGSHVTFLNFDNPYPNHTFSVFLPAENRTKFGTPEKDYKDNNICVTGKVEEYHGKPEIILTDPQQIKEQVK
jgi:DNA/RNA endonuclease YhcR with UshA esterase domain